MTVTKTQHTEAMSTASTCLSILEFPFSLQIKKGCVHLECELRHH